MVIAVHKLFFQILLRTRLLLCNSMTTLNSAQSAVPSDSYIFLCATAHQNITHSSAAGLCIKLHFLRKFFKFIQKAKHKAGMKSQTVKTPAVTSNSECVYIAAQLLFKVLAAVLSFRYPVGLVENRIIHSLTLHPRLLCNGNQGIQTVGRETPNVRLG